MSQAIPTLGQVVGANVRRLRQLSGQTQDDTAFLLRASGLAWSRSNVASLESGRHQDVGFGTALLLARALGARLEDLVAGQGDVVMDPKLPMIPIRREELVRMARGGKLPGPFSPEGQAARQERSEVEQHAARRLDAPIERIRELADRLYGRPLSDEREARLPKGLPPSERRGRRGHVTRALLAELRDALEVLR